MVPFKNEIRVPPGWRNSDGEIEEPAQPLIPCSSGKASFKDALEAKMALTRITMKNSKRRVEITPVRYYRCDECKKYHLTSRRGGGGR